MRQVFDFSDYKKYLEEKLDQNASVRGYRTQLAEAAGCKKSFVSQVLRSHVHFTPDHAANLSLFWRHSDSETHYFIDLVLLARAASLPLQQVIKERMKKLKLGQEDLNTRLKWKNIEDAKVQEAYFSSWYWTAIYVAVSIDRYRTPGAIAARLELPVALVEQALATLMEWKLLKKDRQGWSITEKRIHLPRSSHMNEVNHFHWRQRALANLQAQDQEAIHYSLVFGISRSDLAQLKEQLRKFLENCHALIGPSPSEELACFTCDLFNV